MMSASTSSSIETTSSSSSSSSSSSLRKNATAFDHGIASNIAGSLTALCFHPIDLVKVRIVSQDGTDLRKHQGQSYTGFRHGISSIVKFEGVSALFRGAPLGVIASGFSWGVYMMIYRWAESNLAAFYHNNKENDNDNNNNNSSSSPLHATALFQRLPASAVASASASVLVSFLMCPLFLIKTRMMLEDVKVVHQGEQQKKRINKTFYHGVKHAIEQDGVRSLWRGFSAQLVMCVVMAIYMPLYESIRHFACKKLEKDKLNKFETSCVTVCAKLGVTLTSHPVGLVKARIQDQRARKVPSNSNNNTPKVVNYVTLADTCRTIIRREGLFGFYRGITVGLAQSTGRSIFQMLIYEDVLMKVMQFRK